MRKDRTMRVHDVVVAFTILALAACGTSVDPDGGVGMLDAARTDGGRPSDAGTDAGPPGCTADGECEDGVDCTADTCTVATGTCRHQVVPALCPAGSSCHPVRGCEMGRPCATDEDCADDDACTTNERCDPAARVCVVDPLDGDGDGDPPRVCGGMDCDDSRATVYAGAPELCNTVDDDCDGTTDEGLEASVCSFCRTVNACGDEDMHACYMRVEAQLEALACSNRAAVASAIGGCATSSCSEYRSCRDAAGAMCACGGGRTLCGGFFGACTDTATDSANCGACGSSCPSETMCAAGSCTCPGGLTLCGTRCIDTSSDDANCGTCGTICPSGASCTSGTCRCPTGTSICDGACVDTSSDYYNCGACGVICTSGACMDGTCTWTSCPSTPITCGGTTTCPFYDPLNCGACGVRCAPGVSCVRGVCS
ncbi:MAG: MopE-related protein [Sandaracinaceae bacterium]|nr:MopE-related protein [Sandaracinaceae bacterium]